MEILVCIYDRKEAYNRGRSLTLMGKYVNIVLVIADYYVSAVSLFNKSVYYSACHALITS